jgi:hypothetical protein
MFALALLGFVTGEIMASSREPAVGTVLPAVLTLLGAVIVYLTGAKGIKEQIATSMLAICFVFSFFFGSGVGAQIRGSVEDMRTDPAQQRDRELAAQDNKHAIEVRRLKQYLEFLELKRDLSAQSNVDLTKFKSTYEVEPNVK